jgi:hypothetical protein
MLQPCGYIPLCIDWTISCFSERFDISKIVKKEPKFGPEDSLGCQLSPAGFADEKIFTTKQALNQSGKVVQSLVVCKKGTRSFNSDTLSQRTAFSTPALIQLDQNV